MAEPGILYYGLFSWRARPDVPAGARAFSIHQKLGQADMFGLLPIVCVFEIVPVHLLLSQWSWKAAWVATAVGIYSLIWVVGLARAFRLRPTLVTRDSIRIRYGLLFSLHAPREKIADIRAARAEDRKYAVPARSEPTMCIELTEPIDAELLFGRRGVEIRGE